MKKKHPHTKVLREFGPYQVRLSRQGHLYCTCPKWLKQHQPPTARAACQHIITVFLEWHEKELQEE